MIIPHSSGVELGCPARPRPLSSFVILVTDRSSVIVIHYKKAVWPDSLSLKFTKALQSVSSSQPPQQEAEPASRLQAVAARPSAPAAVNTALINEAQWRDSQAFVQTGFLPSPLSRGLGDGDHWQFSPRGCQGSVSSTAESHEADSQNGSTLRTGSGGLRMSSVAGGAPAASAIALMIASASGYSGYAAAFERALCSGFMHSMYSETSICAGRRVEVSWTVPTACALQAFGCHNTTARCWALTVSCCLQYSCTLSTAEVCLLTPENAGLQGNIRGDRGCLTVGVVRPAYLQLVRVVVPERGLQPLHAVHRCQIAAAAGAVAVSLWQSVERYTPGCTQAWLRRRWSAAQRFTAPSALPAACLALHGLKEHDSPHIAEQAIMKMQHRLTGCSSGQHSPGLQSMRVLPMVHSADCAF